MSGEFPLVAAAGIALSGAIACTLVWLRRGGDRSVEKGADAPASALLSTPPFGADSTQLPPNIEYEWLFSLSPHPMYVYDTETLELLAVNDAALRRYGYERREFLALTLSDIRPDEDVAAMKAMTNEVAKTRSVALPGVWRHKRKDGSVVHVRISGHELPFDGRPARIVHAVDVSAEVALEAERERMIAKLQTSREWLASTVNAGRVGLWERDLPQHQLVLGGRWAEILGTTAKAFGPVTEERLLSHVHPDEVGRVGDKFVEYLKDPVDIYVDEYRLRHASGEWIWVLVRGKVAERDGEGRVRRMTGTMVDITSLKTAQAALARQQAAEQANVLKTQFLSRVSHELRTPLNAVLGFAQLMQLDADQLPLEQQDRVNRIERAGQHLLALINDLMDLSRLELGAFELQEAPVDMNRLLDDSLAMADAQLRERGVTVQREIAPELPEALGDALRLRQCLLNLLSNAIKYNQPQDGRIRITLRRADSNTLALEVWNTGIGLTPAQIERLYEPFNRLGRDASHAEGTGIGLTISRQLIERMGGAIEAESVVGQWACFTLKLRAATAR